MLRLAALCLSLLLAAPAAAQDFDDLFGTLVRRNAEGALAVMGLAVVPSETASALFLDTGSDPDQTYDFTAAQLGGGFRVAQGFPLYLEGFIGWNRYDPVLIFSEGARRSEVPLKWTTFGATGGIGYEFDLGPHWKLRPLAHISVGRVQSDISVGAQAIANRLGIDTDSLRNGGVTAGGGGGSLTLAYNRRWLSDWEADLSLRYTYIELVPIAGDSDLVARAIAETTTLWTRLRIPTGAQLFDRPVRTVAELSGSYLPGDQGEVLNEDWLVQVGAGGEVDLGETWVPWVTTTRLMARYTRGENLEGYSLGLAVSF